MRGSRVAAPNEWIPSGSVVAMFERNVDEYDPDDLSDIEEAMVREMGLIMFSSVGSDVTLTSLASQVGYLDFYDYRGFGPERSPLDAKSRAGDALQFWWMLDWGVPG